MSGLTPEREKDIREYLEFGPADDSIIIKELLAEIYRLRNRCRTGEERLKGERDQLKAFIEEQEKDFEAYNRREDQLREKLAVAVKILTKIRKAYSSLPCDIDMVETDDALSKIKGESQYSSPDFYRKRTRRTK